MRNLLKARIPVQQRGIETKEKIISAAMTLFADQGYHKTNAMEIAAKAEIATGTFYSYFNNKKEVFIEIMVRVFKSIADNVLLKFEVKMHKNTSENYKEFKRLIHFIVYNVLSEYKIHQRLLREILAMVLLDKEVEKMRLKEERKVINLLILFLQTYKEHVRISDFEASSIIVLKFMEEIIHQIKFASTEIEEKRFLKESEDMICRYLLNDG